MQLSAHCPDCGPVRVVAAAVRVTVPAGFRSGRPGRSVWSACRVTYRCPGCGTVRRVAKLPPTAVLLLAAAGAPVVDAPAGPRAVPSQARSH